MLPLRVSEPGTNGNERVLYIPQSSRTGVSPSFCLISYLGHTFRGVLSHCRDVVGWYGIKQRSQIKRTKYQIWAIGIQNEAQLSGKDDLFGIVQKVKIWSYWQMLLRLLLVRLAFVPDGVSINGRFETERPPASGGWAAFFYSYASLV